MIRHTLSEGRISSALSCIRSDSVKLKVIGLKDLAQYLIELPLSALTVQEISFTSLTCCIVRCMSGEFTKLALPHRDNRKSTKGKFTVSIALTNQFEIVVKILSSRFFHLEPAAAISLVSHVVFILRHHAGTSQSDSINLWETSYQSCLATLLSNDSIIRVLPSKVVTDVARFLLEQNEEKDDKHFYSCISLAKRIQISLSLLSCDAQIHRQNLIHAICTRMSSSLVEWSLRKEHNWDLYSLNILCQSFHFIVSTYPLCFCSTLYYCPKTWLALQVLIQNWCRLNEKSQGGLLECILLILKCFQLPKKSQDFFCNTAQGFLFQYGPLRLLLEPLKTILLKNLSCTFSDKEIHFYTFSENNGLFDTTLSNVSDLLGSPVELNAPFNSVMSSEQNNLFDKQIDLLSELILETDIFCSQKSGDEDKSLNNNEITCRLIKILHSSKFFEEYHELLPYVLGVYVIQKLIERRISLSLEKLCCDLLVEALTDWTYEFFTTLSHPTEMNLKSLNFCSIQDSSRVLQEFLKRPHLLDHQKIFWITLLLVKILHWIFLATQKASVRNNYESTYCFLSLEHIRNKFCNPLLLFLLPLLLSSCSSLKNTFSIRFCILNSNRSSMSFGRQCLIGFQHLLYIVILLSCKKTLGSYFEADRACKNPLESIMKNSPIESFSSKHHGEEKSYELTEFNQSIWLLVLNQLKEHHHVVRNQLKRSLFFEGLSGLCGGSLQCFLVFSNFLIFSYLKPFHGLNDYWLGASHARWNNTQLTPAMGDLIAIKRLTIRLKKTYGGSSSLHGSNLLYCLIPQYMKDAIEQFMGKTSAVYRKPETLTSLWTQSKPETEFIKEALTLIRVNLMTLMIFSKQELTMNTWWSSQIEELKEINNDLEWIKFFFLDAMSFLVVSRCCIDKKHPWNLNLFPYESQNSPLSVSANFVGMIESSNISQECLSVSQNKASRFPTKSLSESNWYQLFWEISCFIQQLIFIQTLPNKSYFWKELLNVASFTDSFLCLSLETLNFLFIMRNKNSSASTPLWNQDSLEDEFEDTSNIELSSPLKKKVKTSCYEDTSFLTSRRHACEDNFDLKHFHIPPLGSVNPCHIRQLFSTSLYVWLSSKKECLSVPILLLKVFDSEFSQASKTCKPTSHRKILFMIEQFEKIFHASFDKQLLHTVKNRPISGRFDLYRSFLINLVHLFCRKGKDFLELNVKQVTDSFQALWVQLIQIMLNFFTLLNDKEQFVFWKNLFFREAEDEQRLVPLIQFAMDRLLPYIIGGFWICVFFASKSFRHDDLIWKKFQNEILPLVKSGTKIYINRLLTFKTLSCNDLTLMQFTLGLGGYGLCYVLEFLDQEERQKVLGAFKPSEFFVSSASCFSKQKMNILQEYMSELFQSIPQNLLGNLWELMWRYFNITPFLQYLSCFFNSSYSGDCAVEFLTFLASCTAHSMSCIASSTYLDTYHELNFFSNYNRIIFYFLQTSIGQVQYKEITLYKRMTTFTSRQDLSFHDSRLWTTQFIKWIFDGLYTCSIVESSETFDNLLSRLGLTPSSKCMFSESFDLIYGALVECLADNSVALFAAHVYRLNLQKDTKIFTSHSLEASFQSSKTLGFFLAGFLYQLTNNTSESDKMAPSFLEKLESNPCLFFDVILSLVKMSSFQLVEFNLYDALMNLTLFLKNFPSVILNPLHPLFILRFFLSIVSLRPDAVPQCLMWQMQLIEMLELQEKFVATFQILFFNVLDCFTNLVNKTTRVTMIKKLVNLIQYLPASCLSKLLSPSDLSKDTDVILVFPCSLYWRLAEAFVCHLRCQDHAKPLKYRVVSVQRRLWSKYCMQTTCDIGLESSEIFDPLVESLLSIFEALVQRQCALQKKITDGEHLFEKRKTLEKSLLGSLGYELIFFFPPLENLSEHILDQLIPVISKILHRVAWNHANAQDDSFFCPFLCTRDIRHMLLVLAQSHERRLFRAVFQRTYICSLFSWLLFFYEANAKPDRLMLSIVSMASHILADLKIVDPEGLQYSAEGCSSQVVEEIPLEYFNSVTSDVAQSEPISQHLRNCMITIPYNLVHQGLIPLAQSYIKLHSLSDTGTWASSIQHSVSLPFFFQYLSKTTENNLPLNLFHCLMSIQYICIILQADKEVNLSDLLSFIKWMNGSDAYRPLQVEQLLPWPCWMWTLSQDTFLFHNHLSNTESVVPRSFDFVLEKETPSMSNESLGNSGSQPGHSKDSSEHLCNFFITIISQRFSPFVTIQQCKTRHLTERCLLQLPLLVWMHCVVDDMEHTNTRSRSIRSCGDLINDLLDSFTSAKFAAYGLLCLRVLVSTVCLTRELLSILTEFHFGITQKAYINHTILLCLRELQEKEGKGNVLLSTLKRSLKSFLETLDYKLLAHVALNHLGLADASHLFTHLQIINDKEYREAFWPNQRNFSSNGELMILLKSLSRLELHCEDVFHGNFEQWIRPEMIISEAEANGSHWRRLVLENQIRKESLTFIRPNPFSWWQASGLLNCFPWSTVETQVSPSSREALRMEWLWRLGEWTSSTEVSNDSRSFQGSILYSLYSLNQYISNNLYVDEHHEEEAPCFSWDMTSIYFSRETLPLCDVFNIVSDFEDSSTNYFFKTVLQQYLWITLQDVLDNLSPHAFPNLIQQWVEALHYLNGFPCLFWAFEPVLAYQRQILNVFQPVYRCESWKASQDDFQLACLHFTHQYSRALRLQGLQESALALSLKETSYHNTSSSLTSFKQCLAQWLLVENVHASENTQRSLILARPLIERFQKSTLLDLTRQEAQFAATFLSNIGTWMFEAQWDDFESIEKNFMKPAIVFTEHYPSVETLKSHQKYATLLDQIIQSFEKNLFSQHVAFRNVQHESHKRSLQTILEEIQRIQRLNGCPHHHLVSEQSRLETLVAQENETLEYQHRQIYHFSCCALHHYLYWLSHVSVLSDHTLKSTCRCLSLWFKYSGSSTSVTATVKNFFTSPQESTSILYHLQPFIYQIASRIQDPSTVKNVTSHTVEFQKVLTLVLEQLIYLYPFHTLFPLLLLYNGENVPLDYKRNPNDLLQKNQIQAVKNLFSSVIAKDKKNCYSLILETHKVFNSFLINLGHLKRKDIPSQLHELPNSKKFVISCTYMPIPTALPYFNVPHFLFNQTLSLQKTKQNKCRGNQTFYDLKHYIQKDLRFRLIEKICPDIHIIESGLSQPKILSFLDTSGYLHKIIVKGRDDLRTDAVTEQMFLILNCIFASVTETRERNLALRTYKVIPLSPVVGLIQCITGTITLGDFLVGPSTKPFCDMHTHYFPDDMPSSKARQLLDDARDSHPEQLHEVYQSICQQIHPVIGHALLDIFPTPSLWFSALQLYTRSLALGSMVGYLIGLGDRHTNNILFDLQTGELIHIDFGVLFDRGQTLSIPEVVPFRLTRDLISGLGPIALEGVFRAICEVTLDVLRQMHDVITSILEVFLFDPLYIWAIQTPITSVKSETKDFENQDAQAALLRVQKKNMGLFCSLISTESEHTQLNPIPVPSLVDRLFRQSTSSQRLCRMFSGWSAWL